MEKIILDVDDIVYNDTALIIKHNTGIFYSAQSGGMACNHPEAEGLLLNLGNMFQGFDDCSYGCWHLRDMPDKVNKLAQDLDEFFKKETEPMTFKIRFNYDLINELEEGWWPVIFDGEHSCGLKGTYQGYIHTANCD